jgi:predicted outer membrane repeat protein
VNQSVAVPHNTAANITLGASDPDGDALSFAIVSQPARGSLSTISGNQVTYTPATGYSGADSFSFKANDGSADSNIATVTISVAEVPSLVVTTNGDTTNSTDGLTTLREAIAYASTLSGSPTVSFAGGINGTITLNSELNITRDMLIGGPGANVLAISGNNAARVFNVVAGVVTIQGLTITRGQTVNAHGAGIYNAGSLTVLYCTISLNRATGIADGGGIFNAGTLDVSHSSFINNYTGYGGAGLRNGSGSSTVTNCTFSGNSAGVGGGALQHIGGTMTVRHSTVSGNISRNNDGGGVQNQNGNPLSLTHCIVSGNQGGETRGALTDAGFNLIGGNAGSTSSRITAAQRRRWRSCMAVRPSMQAIRCSPRHPRRINVAQGSHASSEAASTLAPSNARS